MAVGSSIVATNLARHVSSKGSAILPSRTRTWVMWIIISSQVGAMQLNSPLLASSGVAPAQMHPKLSADLSTHVSSYL